MMPKSYEDLWNKIEPLVRDEGCTLFDIEVARNPGQRLRVYIAGPDGKTSSVNVDNCAQVHRRISNTFEGEYGEAWDGAMEVSSPGVNRRLKRPEHFFAAIGERVKLVLHPEMSADQRSVVKGELTACEDSALQVVDEDSGTALNIPLSHIEKAQVDFLFDFSGRE